jgi:hypothetical protein
MGLDNRVVREFSDVPLEDLDKRGLRALKRQIKRKGSQHRRRKLKQSLAAHPEEAADDMPTVGRYVSAELNGLDAKRPPKGPKQSP